MDILVGQNKTIEEKPIILENKENKSLWDELKEFFNELWDLLYIDMKNSYLFITENKNYFICTVILAILLQFTNISNLGTSFEKYCRKELNITQSGGDNEPFDYRTLKQQQRKAAAYAKADKRKAAENAKPDSAKYTKSKMQSKKAYDAEAKQKKKQAKEGKAAEKQQAAAQGAASGAAPDESKENQKRISFFEKLKGKMGQGSWGGQYSLLGPVFGNMDRIMESVKTIFYIITVLLAIVGIISIPVLIFLIITYMIIKALLGKFVIL
jgi:hypothetical protein